MLWRRGLEDALRDRRQNAVEDSLQDCRPTCVAKTEWLGLFEDYRCSLRDTLTGQLTTVTTGFANRVTLRTVKFAADFDQRAMTNRTGGLLIRLIEVALGSGLVF
ncbi:MAG: hypothetical protein IH991_20310 [Planctomycetes bacterium]|nr:hypothetical protein [Planctomycetota bacterium]